MSTPTDPLDRAKTERIVLEPRGAMPVTRDELVCWRKWASTAWRDHILPTPTSIPDEQLLQAASFLYRVCTGLLQDLESEGEASS